MSITRLVTLVWRGAWVLGLFALIGAAVALAISLNTARVYQSSSTLSIDQPQNPQSGAVDYSALLASESLAKTYAKEFTAQPILDKVIANLHLKKTTSQLERQIAVDVVPNTQLIQITVEDLSPTNAAAIANELVKVFGQDYQDRQSSRYAASKQAVQGELNDIQAEIDRTQTELNALGTQTTASGVSEHDRLETLLGQDRSTRATLLQSLEQIHLAEVQSASNMTVIEPAISNPGAIRPRTLTNVGWGIIVGLLISLSILGLRAYLDTSIKTLDDAVQLVGAPGLGTIASIEGVSPADRLVAVTHPRSPIAEAYRVLSTNIAFAGVDKPIRALLVNSGGPGEGKTTTTANLAVTMARLGKRVIVVDADLHKPALHRYFSESNARGLTTALLEHSSDITQYLLPTAVENLRLLPSGPIPPDSAQLLGTERMAELAEELKAVADVVVFDTPPSLILADATILARMCDATLLVIWAGHTRIDHLRKTREQLLQSGTRLLGFVFNHLSADLASYGGGYYYYYSYYGSETQQAQPWYRKLRWPGQRRHAHRPPTDGRAAVPTGSAVSTISRNGHSAPGAETQAEEAEAPV